MLPSLLLKSEAKQAQNDDETDTPASESGSEDDAAVTEEEIMKGRSTVNDIATFLQQMRCSEEQHATDEDPEEVKARSSSSAARAQYHWRRSISKVLATVRLTRVIRKREFQPRDFEKVGLVGTGSMASVYLVRMKGTEKLYAMKVLRKKDYPTKRAVQRAIAEREVLLMCNHPFITDMYFAFQTERKLYLVLEYCSGGDLSTLVERLGRPLTEQELRFYICEIILALEYLHACGVIYRDLKPKNVLIHRSGHLRLADFSIATAGEVDTFTPDKQKRKKKHARFDSKSKRGATQSTPSSPVPSHKFIEGWNVSNDRPRSHTKSPASSRPTSPPSERNSEAHTISGSERMSEGHLAPTGERMSEPHLAAAEPGRGRRRSWIARLLRRPLVEEADVDTETEHKDSPNSSYRVMSPTKGSSDTSMLDRLKAKLARTPVHTYKQGRASFGVDVKLQSNSLVGTVEYMAPEVILGHEQGAEIDWWALGVLSYELVFMETPFYAPSRREVFVNILQQDPVFHHPMRQLSDDCVSLLRGLLQKAPAARLGSEGRVSEIKQHPFFKDVHWALIANEKPPFEPQEHGPLFSVGEVNNLSSVSRSDAEEGGSGVDLQPRNSNANEQDDQDVTIKKSKAPTESRRPSLFEDVFDSPRSGRNHLGEHGEHSAEQEQEQEPEQDRMAELTGELHGPSSPKSVSHRHHKGGHQHRRSLSENLHELRDPFDGFDMSYVNPEQQRPARESQRS